MFGCASRILKGRRPIPKDEGSTVGSRSTRVYQTLLERIRGGDLRPGARLREDDLAAMLGVSRTPVREALGRLQARGLVQPVQGGLAIVEMGRPRIMELYAMRGILEGAAARFAAENASPGDLDLIRLAASRFLDNASDASALASKNVSFHTAIYEAAHNVYLTRMLEDLNDSLALLPQTTFAVEGRSVSADAEHRDILAAIEARDPDRAEKSARMHIRQALQARLTLML